MRALRPTALNSSAAMGKKSRKGQGPKQMAEAAFAAAQLTLPATPVVPPRKRGRPPPAGGNAEAEAKRNAEDAVIRYAKQSCLESRKLNGDKAIHGDVSAFATKFLINRRALRTALDQPGWDDVRAPVLGPPQNATCEHNRRRSRCRDCGGGSICPHGRRKGECLGCNLTNPSYWQIQPARRNSIRIGSVGPAYPDSPI